MENAKLIIRNISYTVLGLAILLYVGFQVYSANTHNVKTEMAFSQEIIDTINTNLFILRNEKVITSTNDGVVVNVVDDAQRIHSGGNVAYVFNSSGDAEKYIRSEQIDETLDYLESLISQKSVYTVSHDNVDKSIVSTTNSIQQAIIKGKYTEIGKLKSQLLDELNQRQLITGTLTTENIETKISDLRREKSDLGYSNYKAISVSQAGTFVGTVDGYENVYNYDDVLGITPDEVESLFLKEPEINEMAVGKILTDFEWYMVCSVDKMVATKLKVGLNVKIILPFAPKSELIGEVLKMNIADNGQTAVVIKCNYMDEHISSMRNEVGQIVTGKASGLRVSSTAIRTLEDGTRGVYVLTGNSIKFKKVNIVYSENEFLICQENTSGDYLQLYDEVVVSGKGLYDGKIVR